MFSIRRARPSDAKALADLAESTFRATFGATNTPEDMERHCRSSFDESIQSAEIADLRVVTLLGEANGALVGFAQLRWEKAPPFIPAKKPGEIQRLYVHQDWHGKGVAQQLMAACLDEITSHDSDAAWLGVWEGNPRAIAFYSKLGFIEAGDHIFLLGRDRQRDLVMVKVLAPMSPS